MIRAGSTIGMFVRDLLDPQNRRVAAHLMQRTDRGVAPDPGRAAPVPPIAAHFLHADPAPAAAIPARVFQTWKSRSVMPANYAHWRRSYADRNPGFEVLLWDDADNRAFVAARFAWLLPVYDALPSEIYRADMIRPLFLFLFGGFYADMDSECLRPLEPLRHGHDVLLGRMGPDAAFAHGVPNALMASRPFQLFWLLFLAVMLERIEATDAAALRRAGPEAVTGPVALKTAVDIYEHAPDEVARRCAPVLAELPAAWRAQAERGRLSLLPADAWYPLDWNNRLHRMLRERIVRRQRLLAPETARRLFPHATLVTYWTHSW